MRLVGSSDPEAVERDRALSILAERAVLTRTVCRELREAGEDYATRRTTTALSGLLQWVRRTHIEHVRVEPQAGDGIDEMARLQGTEAIVAEIRAGARVCDALFMLLTADSTVQADSDRARLRAELEDYWARHPSPAVAPLR